MTSRMLDELSILCAQIHQARRFYQSQG
jgi:hypothetical protein